MILASGNWPMQTVLAPWRDKTVGDSIKNAVTMANIPLTDEEVGAIVEFLNALTDKSAL